MCINFVTNFDTIFPNLILSTSQIANYRLVMFFHKLQSLDDSVSPGPDNVPPFLALITQGRFPLFLNLETELVSRITDV